MFTRTVQRSLTAAGAAALLTALAGCSLFGQTPAPKATSAANDAAAAKFVACLTQEGQTAKILDGGMVGLLMPDAPGDGSGDSGTLTQGGGSDGGEVNMSSITEDDEGTWQSSTSAEAYPEDNGMRAAWLACEAEVPDFTQPMPDVSGAGDQSTTAEQMEAALAVADCARENGFADFPDPDDNGAMNLPTDITEDGFRQLLEDCMDPESPMGAIIDKETADALDFDMMAVLQDFMEAHPDSGGTGGATGGAVEAK